MRSRNAKSANKKRRRIKRLRRNTPQHTEFLQRVRAQLPPKRPWLSTSPVPRERPQVLHRTLLEAEGIPLSPRHVDPSLTVLSEYKST